MGFVVSEASVVVGLGDMEEAEGMWYFVVMRVWEGGVLVYGGRGSGGE